MYVYLCICRLLCNEIMTLTPEAKITFHSLNLLCYGNSYSRACSTRTLYSHFDLPVHMTTKVEPGINVKQDLFDS